MANEKKEYEIPPLKVGEDGIVYLFDPRPKLSRDHPAHGRGYMGVEENGNIHVFWHRFTRVNGQFQRVLVHSGGVLGFDDIERPMRQCVRMIKKYIGVEETVEELGEQEPEETSFQPPLTLREFTDRLGETTQTVIIPGHVEWVRGVKGEFDRAIRQMTINSSGISFGNSRKTFEVLSERLNRSKNPFLKEAGEAVDEVLASDDRFAQFAALRRGNADILDRMAEIDNMVVAIMGRFNRLDAHRSISEDTVLRLANVVFDQKMRFNRVIVASGYLSIVRRLSHSAEVNLGLLITNPFKIRSQKLSHLVDLENILEAEGSKRVEAVIDQIAGELSIWKDDIRQARRGRFEDRFPVS